MAKRRTILVPFFAGAAYYVGSLASMPRAPWVKNREVRVVNKKDLKRFRDLMMSERAKLIKNANKTLSEEATLDVNELPDEIDQASAEYSQSFIFRLRDREKFYLSKIDKALQKIDAGDFGICEECGEEISIKRLEARPVTTLCIRCKEEQEMEERSYG
jgi:DnaK suppressor protein